MGTRQLGTSDLHITPIGFGAWAIGGSGWQFAWGGQDDSDSIATIREAGTPASTGSTRRPSTGWATRRRLSCSFVGRDGAHQVGAGGRAAEDALEGLPVFPKW